VLQIIQRVTIIVEAEMTKAIISCRREGPPEIDGHFLFRQSANEKYRHADGLIEVWSAARSMLNNDNRQDGQEGEQEPKPIEPARRMFGCSG